VYCGVWPNVWMDQDETWRAGRPRLRSHYVRWGLSSPEKGHSTPTVRPMSVVAKRLDRSRCHLIGGEPRPRRHCVRWGPSLTAPRKGYSSPSFRPMSIAAKRSPISATAEHLYRSPKIFLDFSLLFANFYVLHPVSCIQLRCFPWC